MKILFPSAFHSFERGICDVGHIMSYSADFFRRGFEIYENSLTWNSMSDERRINPIETWLIRVKTGKIRT